jgi:HEAT repeat protein
VLIIGWPSTGWCGSLDDEILSAAKINRDDKSLLEQLRAQIPPPGKEPDTEALVRQLDAEDLRKRENASRQLTALGPIALAELKKGAKSQSFEIRSRCKSIVTSVMATRSPEKVAVLRACIRVLANRGTVGVQDSLIQLLPVAACDELEEEIWFALDSLGARNGVEAGVVELAQSKFAASRAGATFLIARLSDDKTRQSIRQLINDPSALVRLRYGQGLLGAKDKAAIPALISVLDDHDVMLAWIAEELLSWIAGEEAPFLPIGPGGEKRQVESKRVWKDWFAKNEKKIDLGKLPLEPRRPGLVFVDLDFGWRVCGWDGRPRWELTNRTAGPIFSRLQQVLPSGELLVVSGLMQQLTIQKLNLMGEPVWAATWSENESALDVRCRQLSDGTIAAVSQQQITRFDQDGEVTSERMRYLPRVQPGKSVDRVVPIDLHHDRIIFGKSGQRQEVSSWFEETFSGRSTLPIREFDWTVSSLDTYVLSNGNLVACDAAGGKASEIARDGKTVWRSHSFDFLDRRSDGATLVYDRQRRRALELDSRNNATNEMPMDRVTFSRIRFVLPLTQLGLADFFTTGNDITKSVEFRRRQFQSDWEPRRMLAADALQFDFVKSPLMPYTAAELFEMIAELLDNGKSVEEQQLKLKLERVVEAIDSELPDRVVRYLGCNDGKMRAAAASMMRFVKVWPKNAKPRTDYFIQLLNDQDVRVRRQSAASCRADEKGLVRFIPILVKLLNDPDPSGRHFDFDSVSNAASHTLSAVMTYQPNLLGVIRENLPAILSAARSKSRESQRSAVRVAFELAIKSKSEREIGPELVPILIEILRDRSQASDDRGVAATELVLLDSNPKKYLSDFLAAWQEKDGSLGFYQNLAVNIPKLSQSDGIKILIECLQSRPELGDAHPFNSPLLRMTAISQLQKIGPAAKDALPVLEKLRNQRGIGIDVNNAIRAISK